MNPETMLRNLLARIHRDGGHFTESVGLVVSVEQADLRVAEMNGLIDAIVVLGREWVKEKAPAPEGTEAQLELPFNDCVYCGGGCVACGR